MAPDRHAQDKLGINPCTERLPIASFGISLLNAIDKLVEDGENCGAWFIGHECLS
jgi:hypothetical protein